MKQIYKFKNWNFESFKVELESVKTNNFYFNDILGNYFKEFFEFFRGKNIKINLFKFEEIDEIIVKKLNKFFEINYEFFKEINISFINFSSDDLFKIFGFENYVLYLVNKKSSLCKTKKLINNENLKLNQFSKKLSKYEQFCLISNYFKKTNKYCYFNFPTERGLDRFVFYFFILNEEDKREILQLFSSVCIDSKIYDLFGNISVAENGFLFAIGFNFKDNKLIRTTLYGRFDIKNNKKSNELFLQKHFDLNYNFRNLFVKDWGLDVFDNQIILKVYFRENNFNKGLNTELGKILENKANVGCLKIKDGEIIDEKFEFSNNLFSRDEKNKLIKMGIFDEKSKLFSIYLDKNWNLKNSVSYNI